MLKRISISLSDWTAGTCRMVAAVSGLRVDVWSSVVPCTCLRIRGAAKLQERPRCDGLILLKAKDFPAERERCSLPWQRVEKRPFRCHLELCREHPLSITLSFTLILGPGCFTLPFSSSPPMLPLLQPAALRITATATSSAIPPRGSAPRTPQP